MTEDLATLITKRYRELLDNPELTPTQLTQALTGAVKWWASTNQPAANGVEPGSGFQEGEDE
jgi:hypothetical protein